MSRFLWFSVYKPVT